MEPEFVFPEAYLHYIDYDRHKFQSIHGDELIVDTDLPNGQCQGGRGGTGSDGGWGGGGGQSYDVIFPDPSKAGKGTEVCFGATFIGDMGLPPSCPSKNTRSYADQGLAAVGLQSGGGGGGGGGMGVLPYFQPIAIDWFGGQDEKEGHCDFESCDPPWYDLAGNEILCPYNCDPGQEALPANWYTNNGMPWYYPTNYRDILYLGTCFEPYGGCGGGGSGGRGGMGQSIPAPPPQTWAIPLKTPADKLSIRLIQNVRATIFWSEPEDVPPPA